jgi:dolichyl-phosphate beta-glucosyltransferase
MILSIVIPAYNEERRIPKTIKSVSGFLRKNNISFELIVVPNNCSDNTVVVLQKMQKEEVPEIKIVTIKNEGVTGNTKGLAISAGMKEANGEYHMFMDADNATSFDCILDFINYVKDGFDVVIASRYVPGAKITKKQPITRIMVSRVGNIIIRLLLLPNIYDTQCGFKLFSQKASKRIFVNTTINGWGIDLEILALAKYFGFKIKEAPVVWEAQDESTVRSHAFFYTLKELFKIRKNIKNKFYIK